MTFDIFGYNFPHWKTCMGIMHLAAAGYKPDCVLLAPKKQLSIPTSHYRITPLNEFYPQPSLLCEALGWQYRVIDHDDVVSSPAEFGLILGARILKQTTIDAYKIGIINIHPGILPGNRGLDNVKHAIAKLLPIGATAHWIDGRVDMGSIICRHVVDINGNMELSEVVPALRHVEMMAMMDAIINFKEPAECIPVVPTPKFTALEPHIDQFLPELWMNYKRKMI